MKEKKKESGGGLFKWTKKKTEEDNTGMVGSINQDALLMASEGNNRMTLESTVLLADD
jgi:hypothetical protein